MTTPTIAQVTQRGSPGLSPPLVPPDLLLALLAVFLLDFLRKIDWRFDEGGFAGGGGGGSFVTLLMIRPAHQAKHWRGPKCECVLARGTSPIYGNPPRRCADELPLLHAASLF